MKILHLSATKTWGGGENHIENLCTELKAYKSTVQNLIFCTDGGMFHQKLKASGIPLVTAPLDIKIDPRFIYKLIRTSKQQDIDLIHIHDTTALTLAVMADKLVKLPPFIFSKKTSFPIKDRKRTLYKYNYPKIKRILCVSEATKEITSKGIQDKDKLKVIYHGTNLNNKSDKTPFHLRAELQLKKEDFIIGNIANHIRSKNLESLIEAADFLINREGKKNIQFVQMGYFSERTVALKEQVKKYGLETNFHFLGFTPNASNFIPQFDLLVLSSQSEGLPGVIYEAFYHKTPVVSTCVGGVPEIISHKENGLLSPAHNAEALAKNILSLAQNKELQHKFTELAHAKLIKNFSTKTMAEKTLQEYEEVLGKNGKRRLQNRDPELHRNP